jgi:hypothetical protein
VDNTDPLQFGDADKLVGGQLLTEMSGGLPARLGYLGQALSDGYVPDLPKNVTEALREGNIAKAESLYLDSIGIHGTTFYDRASRKHARDDEHDLETAEHTVKYLQEQLAVAHDAHSIAQINNELAVAKQNEEEVRDKVRHITRNTVIFNDKNIQRVLTHPEGDADKIKFSKRAPSTAAVSAATAENDATTQAIDKLRDNLTQKSRDTFTNMREAVAKHLPGWLTNHQLVEKFGTAFDSKTMGEDGKPMNGLRTYVGVQQLMTKARNELAQVSHEVAVGWDKLNKVAKQQLANVMHTATLQQIAPDVAFDADQNSHLTAADKPKYDALVRTFDSMPEAAKAVYRAAQADLKHQWDERSKGYNASVTDMYEGLMADAMDAGDSARYLELEKEAQDAIAKNGKILSELKGPYFPLMRFGENLVIGKSAEFTALEDQIKDATGKERVELQNKLDAMKKDAAHYAVSAHETKAAANAGEREYKARGMTTYQQLTDQHLDSLSRGSQHQLATLIERTTAGMDSAAAADVKRSLTQMYLQALPEMHALRREAQRRGVEGASSDMLRAYAASSETNAFFTSRLRHAKDLSAALYQMKAQAKSNTDLQHIHREMEKRLALDMTYHKTPIQDAVASMSWLYHLGVSPSFMLINATQPWLITAPVLASRHGMARALGALGTASTDAVRILSAARWKDGKWDAWAGIDENTLPNTAHGNVERKMLRELMQKGILDEGQQHDLNQYAADSSRALTKFNRVMGWTTQQVELVNRMTSALAAFRLAYNGGNYEAATQAAYDTTMDTQFDYSAEGTARIMREGGGVPLAKLVFQFRRYQQAMLHLLVTNAKKSFGSGEEGKQARATLAYIALTSGMAAGALGLPFAGLAMGVANLFMDDDSPEGDAETRLRNMLFDMTGDKDVATVLAKGLPAALGMDIAKRAGLGDVASVFPMAKFNNKNGKEDVKEALFNAVGPAAGMAASIWDGLLKIQAGDVQKGLEKMTPKAAADLIKAARYSSEGMTDSKGHKIGTELSGFDIALRGMGITPVSEANYYEGTRAIKDVQDAVTTRMGKIGEHFKLAIEKGDMTDVRSQIDRFNEDHPEHRITGKVEQQWRKEVRTDAKARATGSGVKQGTGRNASYNSAGRFAI